MKKKYLFVLALCFLLSGFASAQNNLCDNATVLTPSSNCQPVQGSFNGATIENAAPCTLNSQQDVWYQFTATDETMRISVITLDGLNPGMQVLKGSCTGPEVSCINNNSGGFNEVYFANTFEVGETYYVRVYNAANGLSTSTFNICLQQYPNPVNELCANATELTTNLTCTPITGSLSGSEMENASACIGTSKQDVWYQFTATDETMRISVITLDGLNPGMQVLKGSCTGPEVSCINNNSGGFNEVYFANTFEVGENYYVRVYNASSGLSTSTFNICLQQYPNPVNELCANATELTTNLTCTPITGSLSGSEMENASACSGTSKQDVWYQFTATDETMRISVITLDGLNPGMQVLKGSCTGPEVSCINNNSGGFNEVYFANTFEVGENYYVRVYNAANGLSTSTFNICLQQYPNPVNELCANATELTTNLTCTPITGSLSGSEMENASACIGTSKQDVWYQFTATDETMRISVITLDGLNPGMQVLKGSCTGPEVSCINNNSGGFNEVYFANTFEVGEIYYVRVYNAANGLSTSTFNICLQQYPNPVNELCANATELTTNLTCTPITGSLSGSEMENVSACIGTSKQDVWYQFTATDETMRISVITLDGLNPGMQVLKGSCTGPEVSCINNNSGGFNEVYFANTFEVGENYYVRVYNASSGLSTSTFNICLQQYPNPVNELCANATELTTNLTCTPITGSLSGSEMENASACIGTSKQDVWYQFTATDETMRISVITLDGLNPGMQVLKGSCTGPEVSCINNNSGGFNEVYFANTFEVGETYYVRVYHASSGLSTSTFNICLQNYPKPSNDSCANATELTPAQTCTTIIGTISGAQMETPTVCTPNSQQDVWYKFMATDKTMFISISVNDGFNPGFTVFPFGCGEQEMACLNSNSGGFNESYFSNTFTIGEYYYIRVYNAASGLSTATFSICVQGFPAPSNDTCSEATELIPGTACNAISGTMSGSMMETPTICTANSVQDVWFKFVANNENMRVTVSPVQSFNVGFTVFAGNCGTSEIACLNSTGNSGTETHLFSSLVIGQTYYVRVYNVGSSLITLNFNICTQSYPSAQNNLCANASILSPSTTCNPALGTFTAATSENPSACSANAQQDVWYKFIADNETMRILAQTANTIDIGFEIMVGNCAGSVFGCANSFATTADELLLANNFTPGETYYIRVFNASGAVSTANFTICIQNLPNVPNDFCSGAILLTPTAACTPVSGTFTGSSMENASVCTANSVQDVWYKFTADQLTHRIIVTSPEGTNPGFEVFMDTCAGASVACQNSSTGTQETFHSNAFSIGETYYIRVYNAGSGISTAGFDICVRSYPAPANDDCANATEIIPGLNCEPLTASLSGAILKDPSVCTANSQQDVWFKFTANHKMMRIDAWTANSLNIDYEVRSGSCTGEIFACNASSILTRNTFVVGETYYIRVFNASGTISVSDFEICVQGYPQPANELCANAITINPSIDCTEVTGTMSGSELEMPSACSGNALQDVWYKFVATNTSMRVKLGVPGFQNLKFQIIKDSCSGSEINCTDTEGYFDKFYDGTDFIVGDTYYIRVFIGGTGVTTSDFNLCVRDTNLGIETPERASFVLFPNPATDILNLSLPNATISSVGIFDVSGKQVLSQHGPATTVNVASLQSGLYLITVTTDSGLQLHSKFLK